MQPRLHFPSPLAHALAVALATGFQRRPGAGEGMGAVFGRGLAQFAGCRGAEVVLGDVFPVRQVFHFDDVHANRAVRTDRQEGKAFRVADGKSEGMASPCAVQARRGVCRKAQRDGFGRALQVFRQYLPGGVAEGAALLLAPLGGGERFPAAGDGKHAGRALRQGRTGAGPGVGLDGVHRLHGMAGEPVQAAPGGIVSPFITRVSGPRCAPSPMLAP